MPPLRHSIKKLSSPRLLTHFRKRLLTPIGFMFIGALAQTKLFTPNAKKWSIQVTTPLIGKSTLRAPFLRMAPLPTLRRKGTWPILFICLSGMNALRIVEPLNVPSTL